MEIYYPGLLSQSLRGAEPRVGCWRLWMWICCYIYPLDHLYASSFCLETRQHWIYSMLKKHITDAYFGNECCQEWVDCVGITKCQSAAGYIKLVFYFCIDRISARSLTVVAGEHDITRNGEEYEYPVESIVVHPQYAGEIYTNFHFTAHFGFAGIRRKLPSIK